MIKIRRVHIMYQDIKEESLCKVKSTSELQTLHINEWMTLPEEQKCRRCQKARQEQKRELGEK